MSQGVSVVDEFGLQATAAPLEQEIRRNELRQHKISVSETFLT